MGGLNAPTNEIPNVVETFFYSGSDFYSGVYGSFLIFETFDVGENAFLPDTLPVEPRPPLPDLPPEVDFTTQSDGGSIKYSYPGTFRNAYDISGDGLQGPDGWLNTGLYLATERWSQESVAAHLNGPYGTMTREIVNTGTISGTDYSIYSDIWVETLIRNAGELYGDVALGNDTDRLINTGLIEGAVFTGDHPPQTETRDDVIENHGIITGPINLGGGHDTYVAYNGGRVGTEHKAAVVHGMDGNDIMTGGRYYDLFRGGRGDDKLKGGSGDDRLFGNGGDDLLGGGRGDDLLDGGYGVDRMGGGDGNDVFRFRTVHNSKIERPADRIVDFQPGADRIDLSRVAQDIGFVGTAAFSGTGGAELRYELTDKGAARVLLDADGDGSAEMHISALHTALLLETDFIL